MKIIALILSLLLLTSCSNPDTSGGVALSRGGGGDWDNTFPNGSCKGPDQFDNQGSKLWLDLNPTAGYYIMPNAGQGCETGSATLGYANEWYEPDGCQCKLTCICPNGIKLELGNNCPF